MLWESKFAQINLNEGVEFFVAFFLVAELSLTHLWVAEPKKKKKKKEKHLLFLRKLIPACVCVCSGAGDGVLGEREKSENTHE